MDYTGKRTDVVDAGGEIDYSEHTWFTDIPERPPPPEPQPAYNPDDTVINMNMNFTFALGAASNVLYSRYKEYGELGVLAWCAEFNEMIEHLQKLGMEGNMFVNTRNQALQTCTEVLKVPLDIKMQIIVIYLSSLVAKLRKFLTGDTPFNDYPPTTFPIDPLHFQ